MPMPSRGNPLKGEGRERGCGTFAIFKKTRQSPVVETPSRGKEGSGDVVRLVFKNTHSHMSL